MPRVKAFPHQIAVSPSMQPRRPFGDLWAFHEARQQALRAAGTIPGGDKNNMPLGARRVIATHYRNNVTGATDDWGNNDGHRDAFRHAYWTIILAQTFGVDFARAYVTAHEGGPRNSRYREAMDLYNDYYGLELYLRYPNATGQQLQEILIAALEQGDLIVIGQDGKLAWSDSLSYGQHGYALPDVVTTGPFRANPRARPDNSKLWK